MAAPSEPYVDIKTGLCHPTGFAVLAGGNFSWYNSSTTGKCTVTITGNWCTVPSSALDPDTSYQSTVSSNSQTGSYQWSSTCCSTTAPVKVTGGHG